jgi:hypothetical protein
MQQKAACNRRERGLGLQQIGFQGYYPETTISFAAV